MTEIFGRLPDGQRVDRVTISGDRMTARFLTYGATLQDLRLKGVAHPLTLGSDHLAAYLDEMRYFGALVGPVANRVTGGRMTIAGRTHQMALNEPAASLHSGPEGLHNRVWQLADCGPDYVQFAITLRDGECGLPGRRDIRARYRIAGKALILEVEVETDAETPINIANHSYWDLNGRGSIAGHRIMVAADHILETDAALLPTGRLSPVKDTHFDLRELAGFHAGQGRRYDDCYVLSRAGREGTALVLAGERGVTLSISTTEPGLQVFDAGGIAAGRFAGHSDRPYGPYCGIALEAQGFPDAPNHPEFPSIITAPGRPYRQETSWQLKTSPDQPS